MVPWTLTINRGEDHSGVVIGDNVCIAILWLVDLHVGVFPGKLLARINRLRGQGGERINKRKVQKETLEFYINKETNERKYFLDSQVFQ